MTKGQWGAVALVACFFLALWTQWAETQWHAISGSAVEIRLIGECDGKFYGAMEESDFPDGCAWIEPILYDVE